MFTFDQSILVPISGPCVYTVMLAVHTFPETYILVHFYSHFKCSHSPSLNSFFLFMSIYFLKFRSYYKRGSYCIEARFCCYIHLIDVTHSLYGSLMADSIL